MNVVGSAMELWAGSNATAAIDLYDRSIYKGIVPSSRFAHFVIYDAGEDPTACWGRMQGRGIYDAGPAMRSRI